MVMPGIMLHNNVRLFLLAYAVTASYKKGNSVMMEIMPVMMDAKTVLTLPSLTIAQITPTRPII